MREGGEKWWKDEEAGEREASYSENGGREIRNKKGEKERAGGRKSPK